MRHDGRLLVLLRRGALGFALSAVGFTSCALPELGKVQSFGDEDGSPGGTSGSGASGGDSASSGATNGNGGNVADGGTNGTGANGTGANGTGAAAGSIGDGGDGPGPLAECTEAGNPDEYLPPEVTEDLTLTRDKNWIIQDVVRVKDGAMLTVEPCTRVEAQTGEGLVIERGATISAIGTADEPILFTSAAASPAAGDWLGIALLGKAPREGTEPMAGFGGDFGGEEEEDDSSGEMHFVRIEYAGAAPAAALSLGSVGYGSTIDHVMVKDAQEDCFAVLGGTVDIDNLVCNDAGDEMLQVGDGYYGTIDRVFARALTTETDAREGANLIGTNGSNPDTDVKLRHVTLCSVNDGTGIRLSESVQGGAYDAVVMGFYRGLDRATLGSFVVKNTTLFGNYEDTNGSAVATWFNDQDPLNNTEDPGFTIESCLASGGPESDVLNSDKGAFLDDPDWMSGAWVNWD
jgi:hypothetical protein